ncbi:tyrosine-protein phosphatase non-receptor type 23 [Manduca sexta]|uniref:tyrosine-protein phosphatase non-receptor type 23 n=1 Tax=Manduca sexta TaxID=7130 RepID=UPI00188F7409|nr:tyrosine-protein phosphatase non-receptor type 23 [Manduca sexta]
MEAVPKLPMINFELKTSPENTHFGPKLKQYIAEVYKEEPDTYNNEIHQLECLRSAAVRATMDDAGLSALTRYFCQLRALQSRFPMGKGQPAACSFAWKDLYASMSCSLSDIKFEMACILYNIGALHAHIASEEPRTTADSLKSACTHFQNAAWAFMYLREQYPQPPGVDVSTDIMRLLQEICFAQAQECILEKSIQDTRKPSVIGAVATQVLFFYKNSMALLGPSAGTDTIHEIIGTRLYNYWYRSLSFKASYIGCIVCLYQGMHAEEQQKMGERVAFYQLAVEKLAEARKLMKYVEPVQMAQEALTFTNDVVEGKRKAAKNENEFIYHEEVPDKDLLMDMKPVCLVKALAINFNDPEVTGPDIFARLVPIGAHEASSLYSEEKAKLLRHIVSQAEAKNTELTEFMSSLQLDQLEVIDSEQKIPQEIVDRCAAMNAKTEIIQSLVDSMNNLAEIISDVEHSLAEIKNLIQEETLKEKEYQKVMGPRPPSIVQTELSREYHKYAEAHARTTDSNQVLHKAMTLHIANLKLLAQPLDVLCDKIPSIDNIEGLDRGTMSEMRRVVRKARDMQAQRDALVHELRAALTADDVTAKLLARNTDHDDDFFKHELDKHTPKVKIIEQNLAAQENIINKLTSLYASYGDSRRLLTDVLRKRDGLINALITSYDTYEELLGKSQKGQEFYKKLAHNVNQLLTRLRSTCQVQEEERAQHLAQQTSKAPTPAPTPPAPSKTPELSAVLPPGGPRKLKDYLPYMKNRTMPRSVTPQAQMEPLPQDTYYPENIYPTSVRPAPVGSEATDIPQMQLPDGVVMPPMLNNPYDRYATPYAPTEPEYTQNYAYAPASKPYEKPEDAYPYNTAYTPSQYSAPMSDHQQQIYSNPYYSAPQNNGTVVTDTQNPMAYNNMNVTPNQYGVYNDPYVQNVQAPSNQPVPDVVSSMSTYNAPQADLNVNFSQMQISVPKSEPTFDQSYGQYYSQYPQSSTPNTYGQHAAASLPQQVPYSQQGNVPSQVPYGQQPTSNVPSQVPYSQQSVPNVQSQVPYSQQSVPNVQPQVPFSQQSVSNVQPQAPYSQHSATNLPSQIQSDYNSMNYQYNTETAQFGQMHVNPMYSATEQYSYPTSSFANASQSYPTYTNATNAVTSTTNATSTTTATSYPFQPEAEYNPALAQLDAFDKPIKSHVTGEALSTSVSYQPGYQYDANAQNFNQQQQNYQPTSSYGYTDQSNANYSQSYQNHPGYTFNSTSGNYEYNYGSQNSYSGGNAQGNVDPQPGNKDANWSAQVYTNAGTYDTVQSPSESSHMPSSSEQAPNQTYYNSQQGQQNASQPNEEALAPQSATVNYTATTNQATYMQSGQQRDTSVTFSSNQVSSPKENVVDPPNFDQNVSQNSVATSVEISQSYVNEQKVPEVKETIKEKPVEETPSAKSEPSVFDLLSDIDFTVEQKPLMPDIKVPQISESMIKKPTIVPKVQPVKPPPKEEVIERPAKMDIFSDPSLLNKFTQEVKNLQKLVDSLTEKTPSGLTLLDSKWKTFQDAQTQENMTRTKTVAMQHTNGNIVTEVVPYDDSRLTLKSDPNAYINASYYKQLAPWCIPLVISNNPTEQEYVIFWKAVLEYKIACVVCLQSEIEMQGKFYFPTAKGQSLDLPGGVKVILDDVTCTVHWTERKLTVTCGKTVLNVTHYQINVFPAKIVCTPLVLLVDKILGATFSQRLSNQLSGAWLQCARGAGRSAVLALLAMAVCQVRAGQIHLCDMLDAGCTNLYKHRCNILEDTKYLADAYRTTLFYVQGVLCSGTTMFNGEAVSVPSGAAVLPPVTPTPSNTTSTQRSKFSRESFEEMKQSPGLKSGDMKDPLNFLDPLWSLKKK